MTIAVDMGRKATKTNKQNKQHMLLKLRKHFFEIYIYQESCPLALPLLNISNCQSVLKYLSLYGKLFISI